MQRQLKLVNCDNEQLEHKLHALNVLMKQQDERRLVQECIDKTKSRRLQQINVGEILPARQTQTKTSITRELREQEHSGSNKDAFRQKLVDLSRRMAHTMKKEKDIGLDL